MTELDTLIDEISKIDKTVIEEPWAAKVTLATVSLEQNTYAHQVVIGPHEYTVAHRSCKNYKEIHSRPTTDAEAKEYKGLGDCGFGENREDDGHSTVYTGAGRIEPDMSIHPVAKLIVLMQNNVKTLLEAAKMAKRTRLALAKMYHKNPGMVAEMCDDHIDKSGRLLGEIRTAAHRG